MPVGLASPVHNFLNGDDVLIWKIYFEQPFMCEFDLE